MTTLAMRVGARSVGARSVGRGAVDGFDEQALAIAATAPAPITRSAYATAYRAFGTLLRARCGEAPRKNVTVAAAAAWRDELADDLERDARCRAGRLSSARGPKRRARRPRRRHTTQIYVDVTVQRKNDGNRHARTATAPSGRAGSGTPVPART